MSNHQTIPALTKMSAQIRNQSLAGLAGSKVVRTSVKTIPALKLNLTYQAGAIKPIMLPTPPTLPILRIIQTTANMAIPKNYILNNEIVAHADSTIYSKDAILKCIYWYGDKFHTVVSLEKNQYFLISLKSTTSHPMELSDLELYLQKLERDIVDFNLRDIVTKETRNVRDLLIAKAFSNGEFDELPPGEISDPVGYYPMQ